MPVLISLFVLRLALGFAECPSFPANARIVANWFPNSERGTASAIFNASQYFSLVAFTPLMGWLAQDYGWRSVFLAMGAIGLVGAVLFCAVVHSPSRHKRISKREYAYIEEGGALVKLDRPAARAADPLEHPRPASGQPHVVGHLSGAILHHGADLFLLPPGFHLSASTPAT